MKIAQALSDFGVEYIELTSPAASEQSRQDCIKICNMGLKSKILTHIRCHMDDARIAVETGTASHRTPRPDVRGAPGVVRETRASADLIPCALVYRC